MARAINSSAIIRSSNKRIKIMSFIMCLYSAAVVGIIMLLPEILQLPRTRLFGEEKANNVWSIVKENQRAIL